jgi:hypothetical protein
VLEEGLEPVTPHTASAEHMVAARSPVGREPCRGSCDAAFGFLSEKDGCATEIIEPNTLLTVVAFKFREVALELSFDWRDLAVDAYVSRPVDGKLPPGYLLHEGKRVRFRLGDLAPELVARLTIRDLAVTRFADAHLEPTPQA